MVKWLALVSLCALSATTCAPAWPMKPPPPPEPLPPDTEVHLVGSFAFSHKGELALGLDEPCWMMVDRRLFPCHDGPFGDAPIRAATPWSDWVAATWIDPMHLVFRVDWKATGLDPFAGGAEAAVKQAWTIRDLSWTPTDGEAQRMLELAGEATDTQIDLVSGGPPPELVVHRLEIDGGTLRAGGRAALIVQIANRGPGTAYRVVATVRSGLMSLHGQRVGFGRLGPATEKLRRIPLTIPASETSPDTMLVIAFDEGNGFAPPSISRRVPIAAPAAAPVLAVRCWVPGRSAERPDLDAGEDVVVRCRVDNAGTGAANVDLEASIAGAEPTRSPAQAVAAASQATFDVRIAIPRNLAIDAAVHLNVIARDRAFGRSAAARLVGVIRKPRLCAVGQLTHTQYRAKLAELRAARAAGDLTQDQFDRYDAELVSCLNDAP